MRTALDEGTSDDEEEETNTNENKIHRGRDEEGKNEERKVCYPSCLMVIARAVLIKMNQETVKDV